MGIAPTIESIIDEFNRSTGARIELDGGKSVIGGNGPLLAAAHFLKQLQAENAALKAELKAINTALDDPRTDLTMTACEVITELKEQVGELQEQVDLQISKMAFAELQSKYAALVHACELTVRYMNAGNVAKQTALDLLELALAAFKD